MVGLTSLEVYDSIYNITEENIKFEFFTDNFDEISFVELKDEFEETLSVSDITPSHLQHEILGPHIIPAYKKLGSEKSTTDGYIILLICYARSPFRDFENYLRIEAGLDKNDIQLILKQHNSNLTTYETPLAFYMSKDFSEAVHTKDDHEGTIQTEYEDISMKTIPFLTRFGLTFGTLRFDSKPFQYLLEF